MYATFRLLKGNAKDVSVHPDNPVHPVIAGVGLATPLGNTLAATWVGLCAGAGILTHSRVPDIDPAGEPRVNALALRVAREACEESRWGDDELQSAALIVGTSKGPIDAWLHQLGQAEPAGGSSLFGMAEPAAFVASEMGIGGPRLTLSAACASGLAALIRATLMIRAGEISRALVVATESSLHPLFVASFTRLGVIPPAGHGCRPFDQTRGGFVIGEAAAAICLERPDVARPSDAEIIAIDRFALGADATHLTSSDPSGVALRQLLARAIDGRPLDLVHAHGTGTVKNDPIELAALAAALARQEKPLPSLYSHKGAIGHTLGAAGLIAVAINCMAHRNGRVPPNLRTLAPLPTPGMTLDRGDVHRPVRRSLALAAGFGGAIAAVTLATRDDRVTG